MRVTRTIATLGLTFALAAVVGCEGSVKGGGSGGSGAAGPGSGGAGPAGPGSGGMGGAGTTGTGGNGNGGGGQGGGSVTCDIPRVDLLLAVDNSRGMGHKQALLAEAIPDLIAGLVNPPCVDASGVPAPSQPASPLDACPAGTDRVFQPQTDIHIGVVSSSIGGHGSDSCPNVDPSSPTCAPNPNYTNNDKAHLLDRTDACKTGTVPTYASKGFLAWDPNQVMMPPGEGTLDNGAGAGLVPTLKDMIVGAGEIGCGYESQLESVYRFLADPKPYETITVVNNIAQPMGTDLVLLEQRKAFLRPDSLLAVLMLSEENDCSTKEYGQFFYVNQLRVGATNVRLPRPRKECATNPNDPCCKSCGQAAGNCPVDPTCSGPNGDIVLLSPEQDSVNLRCWDQKRRFGIDFLYPIDRYKQAFSASMIADQQGNLVKNPIFSDLDPSDDNAKVRDASLVVFGGILGVPWQDIARDPADAKKGFKAWDELEQPAGNAPSAWDVIVGNPETYVSAKDPLMLESTDPRSGANPITGAPIASPANQGANPINGNEFTNGSNDELQYACVFDLPAGMERDCTDPSNTSCDCVSPSNDSPLCAPNPNDGNKRTLQVRAKAHPSRRQLALAQRLGKQAAVGSICAPQTSNPSAADYGYRQSVKIILDWLGRRGC
jgi:hypothetical protein